MSKKYFGNGNTKKKMENLKNNSTILQRISPKAMITVFKEVMPQLKDKMNELMSKLPSINKEKLTTTLGALLIVGTMLLAGCSQDISNSSRKLCCL